MIKALVIVFLINTVAAPLYANDDTQINERARLENALSELELVRQFVDQTQTHVKRNRRSRFNYKVFNEDIELLKAGIRAYLNHNSTRPLKQDVPLNAPSGEYRT